MTKKFDPKNIGFGKFQKDIPEHERLIIRNALLEGMNLSHILLRTDGEGLRVRVWFGPTDFGVTGWAEAPNRIGILADRDFVRYSDDLTVRKLSAITIAHERHHLERGWTIRKPRLVSTLGEGLVSEGLAQNFELEVLNKGFPPESRWEHKPSPYSVAVEGQPLLAVAELSKPWLHVPWANTKYNYKYWFFGKDLGAPGMPAFAGYSLSYALTKNWLEDTGTTAAEAFDVNYLDVIDWWQGRGYRLDLPEGPQSDRKKPACTSRLTP